MSREILFRGMNESKQMIEGYFFQSWEECFILWGTTNGVPNMTKIDPATVGQYTGLYDKNGVNIFEGDIVEHIDCCLNYKYRGVVCFGKYEQDGSGGEYRPAMCIGFYLKRLAWIPFEWQEKDDEILRGFEKTISLLEIEDIIVIGNIHDNPELVKEELE